MFHILKFNNLNFINFIDYLIILNYNKFIIVLCVLILNNIIKILFKPKTLIF